MPDIGTSVSLELYQGEDFVTQLYWNGDDDQPIPITEPVRAQVKDATGQLILDFVTGSDLQTEPHISFAGASGFLQLSVPEERINELPTGQYLFDLFATVEDPSSPFTGGQTAKVLGGSLVVYPRITVLEAPTAVPPDTTGEIDGGSA